MDAFDANDRFENHLVFLDGVAELLDEQGQQGMASSLRASGADLRSLQFAVEDGGGSLAERPAVPVSASDSPASLRFSYSGAQRDVKPLTLREGAQQGVLFVALELAKNGVSHERAIVKSYKVERIISPQPLG
jgi:hypothetical protein